MSQVSRTHGSNKFMVLLILLVKSSKLLKILKSAVVLKPLVAFVSMGISVFAYSFLWGWWFAGGLVLMLFIHEMGHVAALKRRGFKFSAPVFIPFIGAAIFAPKMGSRHDEAYMAYGGPLVGTIGAAMFLVPAFLLEDPPELLLAICFAGFAINLFNLIPISPFDGGRITQAVGPWFKYAAIVLVFGVVVTLRDISLLFLLILILAELPLPRTLRVFLAWGIYISMLVMLGLGVGDPVPWYGILVITVFGAVATLIASAPDEVLAESNQRPQLFWRKRLMWLGLYLLIGAMLVALILVTASQLPPEARS